MNFNWPTKKLGEICKIEKGKKPILYKEKGKGFLPYLIAESLRNNHIKYYASISDKNSIPVKENEIIIICDGSNSGDVFRGYKGILASTMGKIIHTDEINTDYLFLFLKKNFEFLNSDKTGAATPHLNKEKFENLQIPLPPLSEQKRIVRKIEKLFAKIDEAEKLRKEAIEDAENLLKSAMQEVFEKGEKEGWPIKKLGKILEYEQPTKYIVKSTNYRDDYKTPVLTAGKSFILGYTNEKEGVFPEEKLPVIIFDDFTTESKFVDFPFKVKSSAMKILHPKKELVDPKFIFYRMQMIDFIPTQHKRYWISVYSKFKIPLPPLSQQKQIVAYLDSLSEKIRQLKDFQNQTAEQLSQLRQSILDKAFKGEL